MENKVEFNDNKFFVHPENDNLHEKSELTHISINEDIEESMTIQNDLENNFIMLEIQDSSTPGKRDDNIPLDADNIRIKKSETPETNLIIKNVNVPTPFKRVLFWPDDQPPGTSKRRKTEKIPSVTTSNAWKEYYSKKQEA